MTNPDTPIPTPEKLVADLVLLLDLEERGGDRFVGRRKEDGDGRVFGGQAIAQALAAAQRTVTDDRQAHSLHAYFLRGGSDALPIDFRVKRDLDGRSFSNRRVVACQNCEPILNMVTSFQKLQEGRHHQFAKMPDVPPPEELRPEADIRREAALAMPNGKMRNLMLRPLAVDFRSVKPFDWLGSSETTPIAHVWFRTVSSLPDIQPLHNAVLAYISDYQLLATAMMPHKLNFEQQQVKLASLDHAVWFHDDFRADDWLLYVTDSPWAGRSRGFGRGQIFRRDGRLIASVAQEGMMRDLSMRPASK